MIMSLLMFARNIFFNHLSAYDYKYIIIYRYLYLSIFTASLLFRTISPMLEKRELYNQLYFSYIVLQYAFSS